MPETWTGTPAEWDAEWERKRKRVAQYFEGSSYATIDAVMSCMESLFPMPPRPVEPPSVVTASGYRITFEKDSNLFRAMGKHEWYGDYKYAHDMAAQIHATESEHDAIRALRDGPAPRYESLNEWVRVDAAGVVQSCWSNEERANKAVDQFGGTAHAIYRRVEGKGCVVCGGEIAAVGSRYCESHTSHGGPCSTEAPRD